MTAWDAVHVPSGLLAAHPNSPPILLRPDGTVMMFGPTGALEKMILPGRRMPLREVEGATVRHKDIRFGKEIKDPIDWQEEREVLAREVQGGHFNHSDAGPKAFAGLTDATILLGSEVSRGVKALESIAASLDYLEKHKKEAAGNGG
jgi:hypothetical protein